MAKKKKKQQKRGKRTKGYQAPAEIVPSRIKMPNKKMGELFGRVVDILGNDRMEVFAEDGKTLYITADKKLMRVVIP